jgi:hypothetical protein
MLGLRKRKPDCLLLDVNKAFNKLRYKDVLPYIPDMKDKYNAFEKILWHPVPEQPVKLVACRTKFGDCTLTEVSTSVKILVLSRIAIQRNTEVCFVSGLLGDNYLGELLKICENTNLISLYVPTGVLSQVTSPYAFSLEANFID